MRMNETEKELIAMVLAGRAEAFEPLVTPHRGPLLTLASRLTGNREEALDVVQEALLRAYRSLRSFDPARSFRNWLFQIAANEARDRGRRKGRERAAFRDVVDRAAAPADPEAGHDRWETRSGLMASLTALSPREREVFVLRDIEELDIRETSRVLGCSELSVRVNLSSARKKLREVIRRDFPHLKEDR
jgi:RNA polymerase sigma-70 factor (ECF subfamily)